MSKTLSRHDLQWILQRTPPRVLAEMKEQPGALFMAGGFIRACIAREEAQDIDLFSPSADQAKNVARLLSKGPDGAEVRLIKTDNAYTIAKGFGLPIQVIHRWIFETPAQCADSFDFTIAKSAVWWSEVGGWSSLCHPDFYADLAAKRLIYTSPIRNEDPGGSMLRVLKFYQRGYRIPLSSLGAVMARMVVAITQERLDAQVRIDGANEVVRSNEELTSLLLTEMLREVDPSIDPSHIAHLPDLPPKEPTA